MREYTSPGEVEVSPEENLTDALWKAAAEHPDRPALAFREGDRFVQWSAQRFADEVEAIAKGLMGLGVGKGDKVALYSATRLEWTLLDFAIWAAGAVTVPIYETSSSDQVKWIVSDSDAKVLIAENAELKAEYDAVADQLPNCEHLFVLDDAGIDALKEAGAQISDEDLKERAGSIEGKDVATIVYTSGTTGDPKGVLASHRSMLLHSFATCMADHIGLREADVVLPVVPMFHAGAWGYPYAALLSGSRLVLPGPRTGPRELGELIRRARRADKHLATLSVDTVIRFRSPQARADFTRELTAAVNELVAKYHDEGAPGGRPHRLVLLAHPLPQPETQGEIDHAREER